MNYQQIYEQLIEKGRTQTLTGYFENHHIVPRSMGGSDDASNIVCLTVRQHLISHLLLFKIHRHTHPRQIYSVFAFYEDANHNRHFLRTSGGGRRHGWVRRAKSRITAMLLREVGREKAMMFNHLEEEKRKYLCGHK